MILSLLSGFLLAGLIAGLAYRTHSLSPSGAWGAVLTGGLIFGLGGWQWAVLLLAFFITSSGLSHAFQRRKRGLNEKYAKGSRRDMGQVLGNGGVAALFAVLHTFWPTALWPWAAFAAALAAVNADTWGTELGIFNKQPPRLLTDLRRPVEKGTSGGVSPIGTLAALAGAALIGVLAAALTPVPAPRAALFALVTLGGLLGALFDSWLGATVQSIYFCPACQKETEQHPVHSCGSPTEPLRGWRWMDNDLVNASCALLAAVVILVWTLFGV